MPNVSAGSIASNIYNSINPLPSNISGLLVTIVDQNRFFIENYTGDVIGDSIAEKYQNPLTNLSTAQVIKLMAVQENGVQSVSIGDMSVNNQNLKEMAKDFESRAMLELKSLSKGVKFFKARG